MIGSSMMTGFTPASKADAPMRFTGAFGAEKAKECFDELSMNGTCFAIFVPSPFVPSMNSGQALSVSKDAERIYQQPGNRVFRHSFDSVPSDCRRAL
jgi:hypothetical protein